MRKIKNIVSTGCFFLCLGGWAYSGPVKGADEATQAKETALNTAVAQAISPEQGRDLQLAQAAEPATPAAPAAQPSQPATVDMSKSVVTVGVDGKVEQLSFQELDVLTVLRLLSMQTKRNIIATKDVKGNVSANLYNVTFAEALSAILRPNGFEYIEQGSFIYVYTAKEYEEIRKRDRKPVSQIYHLKYITSTEAESLLKPLMSSTGVLAKTTAAVTGLAAGVANTGGQSNSSDDLVVISDYAENVESITAALRHIDVRPKQVLIEATVLNATLHDENALGIDLISVSGVDLSSLTSGAFTTGGSGGGEGGGSGTAINGPNGIYNNFVGNETQLNTGTDFASGVPQGGLSVGFLSNHVSFFMRALETVSDVTIVTNPKILTLNKQQGYVHIGQRLGYQTTSTNQTSTQQTVQFLDVGTTLLFRPFIAEDGYVRMEINPEDSSGFIDTRGVPQTNTTSVTSNIMIKDGRTIVIGGLFSESAESSRGQVPVLGNIPVLGTAFRRTNDKTIRQETIVMVTPHIINDDTSLYEETLREQADIHRMILGTRAGLQPWGRDRIAHMWYAKAQECLQNGDTEKALMFVDWTLNTNPRMLEAIKLREQLTNMKMDEHRGSTVMDLVKNTLKGDAATTPDKGTSANYPPPATAPAQR